MPYEVQAVLSRAQGAPVTLETILVPEPGPGEALVDIAACGVCHTDLHYREGGIGQDFPYLLGHEAAGTVSAVGPGVTAVEPGDYVILNWRAVCGQCRSCRRGRPWFCFNTHNATQKMTLTARRSLQRWGSAPSPPRLSWRPGSAPKSTRLRHQLSPGCSAVA